MYEVFDASDAPAMAPFAWSGIPDSEHQNLRVELVFYRICWRL